MHKKFFLTRGTLGLALAASVFLGCQDFLGEEKGGQATVRTEADTRLSAQATAPQDSAKDMPAQATEPAKPVATEPVKPVVTEPVKPAPAPTATSLTPEQQQCLDLYYVMQAGTKAETYMPAKNQYGMQNCDVVLGDAKPTPPPPTPLTIEQQCKMYRSNLITHTPPPEDLKYAAYLAEMAIRCAEYP